METITRTRDIDQLMAEADELVHQINANVLVELEETNRIEFERHVQSLKKIKSEIREKADKAASSVGDSHGEGIHEAIVDIVSAMKNLASFTSPGRRKSRGKDMREEGL